MAYRKVRRTKRKATKSLTIGGKRYRLVPAAKKRRATRRKTSWF